MPQQSRYRLVVPPHDPARPDLDPQQRAVIAHDEGPLLVLAGPGTGKTTTLVEAVVERIARGSEPSSVLALTFSRKAAEQLRDRIAARLGRTTSAVEVATFHSFGYGLIRAYSPPQLYAGPLRLLSAPEQDVVLRELLADTPESVPWPGPLQRALGTRGFAREVHSVLARAREKGLEPADLRRLGEREARPDLVAAGLFMDQYLTILDDLNATDYADLIRRASIEAAAHREELRARFAHVFVDEYQDSDPGQVALLRELAGDARNLTVVGDPHQSIYGFRGAEVRGLLDFPRAFPRADGTPAPVVALRTTRRFGPRILLATQRVARRLPLRGSISAEARAAFLQPVAAEGAEATHGEGLVTVRTFDTDRAESEHLADLLRRAHLEGGTPWHEMAVLVRSGRASIPALRRSLSAAGVPVEVAADDLPLTLDPAARPLLDGLRAALNLTNDDADHPEFVDPERAEALLLGPLCGLDAAACRRLSRELRRREKETGTVHPRSSPALLRAAVLGVVSLDGLDLPEATVARGLAGLLGSVRELIDAGASAEEVLWRLWSGTSWPVRLRRIAEAGGPGARRAHRDLDSVVALFDAAARAEERRDHTGVRTFLASLSAQQIPADNLSERGVRGSAVRLLTAHRAKGLEWDLVVVAHVQEEGWPDLRRRSTLLRADTLTTEGLGEPVSTRELLMEERRLFYVACTRARRRLVVTAVASPEDDGEQPSRFLEELGVEIASVSGRPASPLSMNGLVAELRRTLTDPATPGALRTAAARRLARLAGEHQGSRQLIPTADPASWWGTRATGVSLEPLRPSTEPVTVSASLLDGLTRCPARWFLSREAGGEERSHQAANLGRIVHELADRVAAGELAPTADDLEELLDEVRAVWPRLEFRTPWSSDREKRRIEAALGKFLRWHHQNSRELIGHEEPFSTVVEIDGEQVRLRGFADRIELDHDGRVVVVDLKTGRGKLSGPAVTQHLQLALYQYAVDHGAVDQLRDGAPLSSGGAELLQLGIEEDSEQALCQGQPCQAEESPERLALREKISDAVGLIRAERFPARVGEHCRDCAFVSFCPAKSAGSVVQQ